RRPFDAAIAVLPWAMASTVGIDVWLFAHRWSAIEPARVFDAAIFSLLWAAALGLGYLGARLLPPLTRGPARPAAALLAVVLLAVLSDPASGSATLPLWPKVALWPRLETLSETRDLPRLWAALRGTDRVLFLTSSVRLDRNPAWYAPH